MGNEYLVHYGVLGMKWGKRKQRVSSKKSTSKSSNVKKSSSKKKKSIKQKAQEAISRVDKQKVKNIAKTSAIVAGKIAAATALGYVGSIAVSELSKVDWSNVVGTKTNHNFETNLGPITNSKGSITDNNQINVTTKLLKKEDIYSENPNLRRLLNQRGVNNYYREYVKRHTVN